ncbi:Rho1 guanine nucleotide exchange factor 1 [Lineolata rhizophorae]|uniref:Rho1 guanine nucleotide exchange factor 1 n=1 Tax=Lineolata rhizophorae TaxID=578093 RepID=A0A6A6NRH2_9PEZI|nr:Rho1 guanine nucleotide exchange factor 1 [Lineolata rhizophorae]
MADYGSQQGREYGRPPANYGHATNHQRDAAFSSIFGAAPPPGRSQTMTSQPFPNRPIDRAQTMTSQSMASGPPPEMTPRAPPVRQHMNGYGPSGGAPNGYGDGGSSRMPPTPHLQRPDGASMSPVPQQQQQMRQPQPQFPPPLRPDRRPYDGPQRLEPRGLPPGPGYNKPIPNRYPGPSGPALNADPYRSQSMASGPRPQFQGPGAPYGRMSPAQTFRQQPYLSRTTAQGRVVPERPDERTMSMTSYSRDSDYSQTMSGRVIPNRRRESAGQDVPSDTQSSTSSATAVSSPAPGSKTRSPSQSSAPSRTMSMASTITDARTNSLKARSSNATNSTVPPPNATMVSQKRSPLVYPAMLSKVAEVFQDRLPLSEKQKDGLVYQNAFTGAEAVDLIAYIIKTSDRNLALLLGRSLDAQKFFHDVTYAHRLRDTSNEVYQFREKLVEDQLEPQVNGVFTLLTECYSPTCTRDRLCYSIACPRRLEQQQRLNMRVQPGLKREESRSSLHDDQDDQQKLWINTVSKAVADSVDDKEKKRQEVISEIAYTERDFVKDLEYLRDFWELPLRNPARSPIPEHRREYFVRSVFSNLSQVHQVNSRLAEALTRRQQQNPVVRNVGDIFLEHVPRFHPFIQYGSHQLFGKHDFELEKSRNPAFVRFVEETERLKESRKLEVNGYLTKPTTRLARYPLLLENVLKYTKDDNPDKTDIPKVIAMVKDFLVKVNRETGKAENHFNLRQLSQQLVFKPENKVDLKLQEESRELVFKSTLKKTPTENIGDIQAFLFDHAVLLVRSKTVNKREELRVYRKPIPLELLVITQMDEVLPKMGIAKRPSSSLIPGTNKTATNAPKAENTKQAGFPITFKHLGRGGYELTLYCQTQIQQQKWLEHIEAQQRKVRERSNFFTKTILNEGFFTQQMRVNCCVPIDGGRKLVLGTDVGVFLTDRKPKDASFKPRRVLDCKAVTQIEALEQHQILLVLGEKTVYSYSMDVLDPEESQNAPLKRGRKICHANFFKAGVCMGNHYVCCVKTSALSTTIKVYEPMETHAKKQKKTGFAKMLTGSQEYLKPLKEIYIPSESSSIHFLRSKLCVGCAKGFEVVSLETLETQSLLDQADTSLDFVAREEKIKPIHIERLASEFLLCYTDFSFFVNRNGWRARPDWKITWEGTPQSFAVFNPYILAFEPSFIEIRHIETGVLVHITTGKNIRMLHSSTREILYAYEDEMGEDVIASMDFWSRPLSPQSPPHNSQFQEKV